MALRIVGQHKGSITLDLDNATVLDLKKSIAAASGLAASGLKLLAGKDMMRRNKRDLNMTTPTALSIAVSHCCCCWAALPHVLRFSQTKIPPSTCG